MRKLRRKQRGKVEVTKSEESISKRTSSLQPAEEMEEEKYQDTELSVTEEVGVSQQEKSVLSDETDELKEDSIQGLEEMQIERDSSLKPSLNQENVMVQEEEKEEEEEEERKLKEEEEKEKGKEEGEEEEEKENMEEMKVKMEDEEEEHESLSELEVGQQWIHSWAHGKRAMCTSPLGCI